MNTDKHRSRKDNSLICVYLCSSVVSVIVVGVEARP